MEEKPIWLYLSSLYKKFPHIAEHRLRLIVSRAEFSPYRSEHSPLMIYYCAKTHQMIEEINERFKVQSFARKREEKWKKNI